MKLPLLSSAPLKLRQSDHLQECFHGYPPTVVAQDLTAAQMETLKSAECSLSLTKTFASSEKLI
jgi:hypothetical protein